MNRLIARLLPSPRLVDGLVVNDTSRANGYREDIVETLSRRFLADEGSYLVALNATPGTGQAGHAAPTTMDNTKPFIMIRNKDVAGGKSIYLDRIKLHVTAPGTGGTLNYATHLLDSGAGYTSGSVDLSPVSPNGNLSPSSVSEIRSGPVVATANAALQRIIAHQRVRTVIPVAGDIIIFEFGQDAKASGMPTEGTTELERVIACPPVIIPPQSFYKLVLWRASQSAAASYEIEIGLHER